MDRSLRRLAGAILIQALEDATCGPRRCRAEAIEWIQGKTTWGLTFSLCCTLLGRSPQAVRLRLMRQNILPWDHATGVDLYSLAERRMADKAWLRMAG